MWNNIWEAIISEHQFSFSSVAQLYPTLCDSMDYSTPGHLSITNSGVYSNHVHWVSDTIQPSHPLSSPSPPAFNLSQHQGLFKWVSSSQQVAKVSASASVLLMNNQDCFLLGWTGWISSQSKGLSRVFSNTTVQKHQSLALSFLYSLTLASIHDYWRNQSFD